MTSLLLYLTWYLEEKKVRVAEIEQRVKDEFGVVIRVEILDGRRHRQVRLIVLNKRPLKFLVKNDLL